MPERKCQWDGFDIKLGEMPLDPCIYEEIERYANVTVSINRCVKCGNISISWYRQEDTVELETE